MTHYLSWPIHQLPSQVGIDHEAGTRVAQNVEGFVSFGPYCHLEPGNYFGGFRIKAVDRPAASKLLRISVCRRDGRDVLADRRVSGKELHSGIAGLIGVDFRIEDASPDVEIRLRVFKGAAIEVTKLVIFRNRAT